MHIYSSKFICNIEFQFGQVLYSHFNESGVSSKADASEIIVAKHRNGPVGRVHVMFNSEIASFRDLDTRHTDTDAPPPLPSELPKKEPVF